MQVNLKQNNMLWGLLLIALGGFFLLQATGILGALSDLFWTLAFGAAGLVFLYVCFTDLETRWWAAIPGFTLMGLAATVFYSSFAPPFLSDISGAIFMSSIGAGFLIVFLTNPRRWWALIPAGALLSIAGVVLMESLPFPFLNPASVLFIGLGVTFGLLGLLSTYLQTNLRWAYIPAAVLLVLGLVVTTPFVGSMAFIWPLALIAVGAYLLLRRPQADQSKMPAASSSQEGQAPESAAQRKAEAESTVDPVPEIEQNLR